MNRETWIPIAGLVGLFLAGSVMLYATSGPPAPPKQGPKPRPAAMAKAKAKAQTSSAQLMVRKELGERPAAAEGSKNLVLLVASAWRRDQLTAYGGPAETSPWLVQLAEGGAKFDDAVAAGGWALPALVSIATGEHALGLGMVEPKKKANDQRLPPKILTLAERLAGAGYYTMAVNGEPVAGRKASLMQGFDHYRDAHPQGYAMDKKLRAPRAVDVALDLIGDRSDDEAARPFFMQLNLVDLHKPIKVPPEKFKPFEGSDHKIAPYRAVCRRIDDEFKRLSDALSQKGLADDTIIMVVGAHGEGLNIPPSHGKSHGRNVYPSVGSIPWVVSGPGVKAGTTIKGVASQVDVMPTVLGLLGLALGEDGGVSGRDLSPALRGETGTTGREVAFLDTWYYAANRAAVYGADKACMVDFGSGELKDEIYEDGCFARSDVEWTKRVKAGSLEKQLRAWREEMAERGKEFVPLATPKVSKGGKAGTKGAKVKDKAAKPDEEGAEAKKKGNKVGEKAEEAGQPE